MNNYSRAVTILYVEDEEDVRDGYARALKRTSRKLYTAQDGKIGLELYKKHSPDIVISDIKMPNMNGLEMVKAIKEINPNANIIFTTAHSESAYLLEAIELHVEGYLLKPVDKKSLLSIVAKLSKNIMLEKENKEQKEILQHIIDSENNITIITDIQSISFASKSFLNLFGASTLTELGNKFTSVLDIVQNNETLINKQNIIKSMNMGKSLYDFIQDIDEANRVVIFENNEKKSKSFFVNISKIGDTNFLINLTDITKIEQQREVTTKKAYTDGLTGVYNRNKFEEVFEYELKKSKRYSQPLCLALLDIDYFKIFNDKHGHLIGDEILIMLAKEIDSKTRETDMFARWGGEEFVILFTNTDLNNAISSTENFRKNIENLHHDSAGAITSSFGLTQFKDNDTMNSMFKRADEALYNAKSSGRNCVKSIS